MVSSSLDKKTRKTLAKDSLSLRDSISTNTNRISNNSVLNFEGDQSQTKESIQMLFPKCKPRNDYQTSTITSTSQNTTSTNLVSTASSSSQSTQLFSNTHANNTVTSFNINNSKLLKLQSPDHHMKLHLDMTHTSDIDQNVKANLKLEKKDNNYVETNPFRINSNNRSIYHQNDLLFNCNNSALAATSSNNNNMHHYHYPSLSHRSFPTNPVDRSYYFEPDEIEHNPYAVNSKVNAVNIPPSNLKITPPLSETPPALTTTPIHSSPLGSNKNMWDLSPIKANTPKRVKTQSPTAQQPRCQKGQYKKLLVSPDPIEEDLEAGHFYYNDKNSYYQTQSTCADLKDHEISNDETSEENFAVKHFYSKPKLKQSENRDFVYTELKKNEERRIVKSKSGSGIMGKNVN